MGKSNLVTPYMCQVIFLEMRRFEKGELTSQELILRMDLIHLQNFCCIKDNELTREVVASTALLEIIDLDKKLNDTPYEMVEYFRGNNGGINKANKLMVANYGETMDSILKGIGIIDSPIINYVFLALSKRVKDRELLDRDLLKSYIIKNSKNKPVPAIEQFFIKINKEILDIKGILEKQKKVETDLNIEFILNNLITIKEQIRNLNPEVEIKGLETLDKVKLELSEILSDTMQQRNVVVELEALQGSNKSNIINYLDSIKRNIDSNTNSLNGIISKQEDLKQIMDNSRQGIESSLIQFQNSLVQFNNSLTNIDFDSIFNLIKEMRDIQDSSRVELNKHNQLLGETSSGISYVVTNITKVRDVLQALNQLMTEDSLKNLDTGREEIIDTSRELEEFSEKYLKMRGDFN